MKRTPLRERTLPHYTHGQEWANSISHMAGGAVGILITILGINIAVTCQNTYGIISCAVYGFSLIALYAMSSIYHGLRSPMAKKVFQVLDHCTIYFLIAGTYTPILLSAIRPACPVAAWVLFGVEWGLALGATALTAIDLKKYNKISMVLYISMGWAIVSVLKTTLQILSIYGFLWLLGGGISYTVGAALYIIGAKRPFFHTLFHFFVLLGTCLQAVCILQYAL